MRASQIFLVFNNLDSFEECWLGSFWNTPLLLNLSCIFLMVRLELRARGEHYHRGEVPFLSAVSMVHAIDMAYQ